MGKHRLLGRKREIKEEEEDELDEIRRTKSEKEESNNKSEDKVETKSLFGNISSGGLFGSLNSNNQTSQSDKNKKSQLFTNNTSLFSSDLFSGKSLFNANGSSLFSNSSLFGQPSDKKDKEEKEDNDSNQSDGDENYPESNSPKNSYDPTLKKSESIYTKKYVKSLENVFLYHKQTQKYISKGNGFLSLEYAEVDDRKIGALVFRSSIGKKIIEGLLTKSMKKLTTYVKNYKQIAIVPFLCNSAGEKEKPVYEVTYCKIPFEKEEYLEEFMKGFEEVIQLLGGETKEGDEKNDEKTGDEKKEEKTEEKKGDEKKEEKNEEKK